MLRYLTAGESHGKAIIAILEGMPAGLKVEVGKINAELKRRQQGIGRGGRMAKAIRALLKVVATRDGTKVDLEID